MHYTPYLLNHKEPSWETDQNSSPLSTEKFDISLTHIDALMGVIIVTDVWTSLLSQTFLWILVQVWLDPVLAVNNLQEGKITIKQNKTNCIQRFIRTDYKHL